MRKAVLVALIVGILAVVLVSYNSVAAAENKPESLLAEVAEPVAAAGVDNKKDAKNADKAAEKDAEKETKAAEKETKESEKETKQAEKETKNGTKKVSMRSFGGGSSGAGTGGDDEGNENYVNNRGIKVGDAEKVSEDTAGGNFEYCGI